jgi:hypothetical protein
MYFFAAGMPRMQQPGQGKTIWGWSKTSERRHVGINFALARRLPPNASTMYTEDAWGAVFSFPRWLQGRYRPFLKTVYSHDGVNPLETPVSAGIG